MNRIRVVISIFAVVALFVVASGCTYQTGGQNGTQNATQNASHVNVRLPLSRLFRGTTISLAAGNNQRPRRVSLSILLVSLGAH